MSSEWRRLPLGEVAELSGGFAFKSSDYAPSGRFVLRTLNIGGDATINRDDAVYMPDDLYPEYAKFELEESDTLFVMVGATLGKVGFVRRDNLPALLNQNMWRIRADPKVIDPRFLHYSFRHNVERIVSWASGSARGFLRRDDCRNLELPLPAMPEQKAIAHILGTLDDKIELNRKTNETLEAIAKALFKSWFVDFDPVRAKAEGRPTGLPAEMSELFPDSYEESELGEIPRGWKVRDVNDLCEWISSGGTPSRARKDFWENASIPWFKTGELHDASLLDSTEKINDLALSNSSCKLWDSGTILFAIYASPTVGRLGVLTSQGTSNQAAAGLMAKKEVGIPFLRRTLLFSRDILQNIAVGAAQQNINVQILKDHKVVRPPEEITSLYSGLIQDHDNQQVVLARSSKYLTDLRDTLLPKLISGELRVPDAEALVAEAGI